MSVSDVQSTKPFHAETEARLAVSTVPPITTSFNVSCKPLLVIESGERSFLNESMFEGLKLLKGEGQRCKKENYDLERLTFYILRLVCASCDDNSLVN
jgi:hypothetical protein